MIELSNISMKFRMANDRIMSLKEFVVKKLTGKLEYKEFVALNGVSFSIKKGEVVGIVGGNGAGKSTLLKIISGILSPNQGTVSVKGSIAPMLELGAGFDFDLTAKENIFLNGAVLGYSKEYLESKYDEIVEFSELEEFMDVPVRNFSSGMTMRLAFSIATLVNPDVLIVDEILSVGDAHFQKKSSQRMRELIHGGATVILVSHSIEQIREMCSRVIWLERGKVKMIGNTVEVSNAYMSSMNYYEKKENETVSVDRYQERLYSPTYITKFNESYFIVDCWHHRIIYSDSITAPLENWNTVEVLFHNPHIIASDGEVLLIDDSKNDTIKVIRQEGTSFVEIQSLTNIGQQPNKIVYDSKSGLFYGLSASSQHVFVLRNTGEKVIIEKVVKPEYLGSAYIRSFSIIDGKMYFVSGPGKIIVAEIADLSFNLIDEYTVPFELLGMNDIAKIGSYFYITVYQTGNGEIEPRLIRIKDLNQLETNCEDIYDLLGLKGVPYYFSFINDRVFLTEIDNYSSIKSFTIIDDQISDIQVHFDIGQASTASKKRRELK
ncbi:ABC transporter ATP-binding protein [Paenibacillus sp. chi10]|uniref:ABC transporter ATP-binding protein n=1 Tax=Paenibacillus suaedae TaxID=3077233 RepID=A0AAJ2K3K6_9BACL|nr:ABC transporter ATP-binding protein [Paenibacillus sp. chi10]MDT8979779.1 ABC transporter ATP-binding protein [Paenibacillus sp. chi10]